MIRVDTLRVTQHGLRNPEQVQLMVEHVARGVIFDAVSLGMWGQGGSRLMRIAELPDGEFYLCDGLHRAIAIFLGDRRVLDRYEYTLTPLTYEEFSTPNIEKGWWTPLDLEKSVRKPDFEGFKNQVAGIIQCGGDPLEYIRDHPHEYLLPRRYFSVAHAAYDSFAFGGL